jgi:hypothetical protein
MRECDLSTLEDLPNKLQVRGPQGALGWPSKGAPKRPKHSNVTCVPVPGCVVRCCDQYGVPCSLAADGQEISSAPECGGKLLRRLWAAPEPELQPEPYMEEEPLHMEDEARCAKDGGFVFATPSKGSAGECIEKQLVGCGQALELDVAFVTHGTPLFLLNKATHSLVFGLLVCSSDEPATVDPTLATQSLGLPLGSATPCPHQVTAPFSFPPRRVLGGKEEGKKSRAPWVLQCTHACFVFSVH